MAKLIVNLDISFTTDRSLITEDYCARAVEGLDFAKQCDAMDRTKLGVQIGVTNEEHQIDFLFYPKGASKTFSISPKEQT